MRHLHNRPNLFNDRSHLPHLGITSAIIIGASIAAAATAASAASSASSAAKERKQQANMVNDANQKQKDLESKAAGAQAAALQAASDKVKAKKQGVTQTILTSPLGVTDASDQSGMVRPTLLGGGK